MAKASAEDATILEYALKALEQEREHLEVKIEGIRRMIGGRGPAKQASTTEPEETRGKGRKRRVLSEAARKRIAAAQKKRWAAHRKSVGSAAKATKKVAVKRAGTAAE